MTNARTPLFLMANLGAEVSRVFSLSAGGDALNARRAADRAHNIISEIMLFPEMARRAREIEKIADILRAKKHGISIEVSAFEINEYFNAFALRAMNQQNG